MAYVSRSDARVVACPECSAPPGHKCLGLRGKARESVHRERMNAIAIETPGAHPTRTLRLDGSTLYDEAGTELGRIVNFEMDVQGPIWERVEGEPTEGVRESGFVEGGQDQASALGGGAGGPRSQTTMLADPVGEVWDHYRVALERPKVQLTPTVRRWINDALAAVGIDRVKAAIDGLATSEHHRLGGYVGIEYAIKPKQRETIEGRISMMEAKAPQRGANGALTVDSLLARLPSEVQPMVRQWIADVESMLRNPEHRGLAATGQSRLNDLRDKAKMAPEIDGQRIVGWRDLR